MCPLASPQPTAKKQSSPDNTLRLDRSSTWGLLFFSGNGSRLVGVGTESGVYMVGEVQFERQVSSFGDSISTVGELATSRNPLLIYQRTSWWHDRKAHGKFAMLLSTADVFQEFPFAPPAGEVVVVSCVFSGASHKKSLTPKSWPPPRRSRVHGAQTSRRSKFEATSMFSTENRQHLVPVDVLCITVTQTGLVVVEKTTKH